MPAINVPVVLFVFNRPDYTALALKQIQLVRPTTLIVVADGPRKGHPTDAENCRRVREIVDNTINWPVDFTRQYSEFNLGCKLRVSSGLDYVFQAFEKAIIIEDDCLPDPSFFLFCQQLLERYADDERVGLISGDNFVPKEFLNDDSYYFSRYAHIWGWATWRRTWQMYDVNMRDWPLLRDTAWLQTLFPDLAEALYWKKIFDQTFEGHINTWDYQLQFQMFKSKSACVIPSVNLVTNVGVGESATHTSEVDAKYHFRHQNTIPAKLQFPATIEFNALADMWTQKNLYGRAKDASLKGRLERLGNKLRRYLCNFNK